MEINSKAIAEHWKKELQIATNNFFKEFRRFPTLAIVVADGYSGPSSIYVNNKKKLGEEIGASVRLIKIKWKDKSPEEIKVNLIYTLGRLNLSADVDGIIVQLPFPEMTEEEISKLIQPSKDVDGFTMEQKHLLDIGDKNALVPCTAKGVMKIIEHQINSVNLEEVEGKTIAIVNRSNLIGKPLSKLALSKNMTPIICHSKSDRRLLGTADIIVTGCGLRKNFDSADVSTKTQVIVDCSMHKKDGIPGVGDFDKEDVLENCPKVAIASGYGHTGPMTVLALFDNLLIAAKNNNKII